MGNFQFAKKNECNKNILIIVGNYCFSNKNE